MSKLWVTEYASVDVIEGNAVVPALVWPPIATQVIDFTSAATATTNALNADTAYIRLRADTACHVVIAATGSTPATVATTSAEPFEANLPDTRRIKGARTGLKVFAVAAD